MPSGYAPVLEYLANLLSFVALMNDGTKPELAVLNILLTTCSTANTLAQQVSMPIDFCQRNMNKRLGNYIWVIIRLFALGVFWPFCRPTQIGLHFVGPSYWRESGDSALKPSFIYLLYFLKTCYSNTCPYWLGFAGNICPPKSDGDENLIVVEIFIKSLVVYLLEQFEIGLLLGAGKTKLLEFRII